MADSFALGQSDGDRPAGQFISDDATTAPAVDQPGWGAQTTEADDQYSVELLRADQMTDQLCAKWQEIRRLNAQLASPFFDFEFTRCVARVRDDVEIAVLRLNGCIIGFFPFQRARRHHGQPVGGLMNDYHGLIGSSKLARRLPEIIKCAGLKSWRYHALYGAPDDLDRYDFQHLECPYVDLGGDFESYYRQLCARSRTIKKQRQKTNKLVREIGPLRFQLDCRDRSILEKLIDWKRAKYRRTKTFDILSVDWTANLLRQAFDCRQPDIQGLLSALWAGDELVAAHFGLVGNDMLHYWFPVFSWAHRQYSPGTQLYLEIAREGSAQGIRVVDLGYGTESFKLKWATGTRTVRYGSVAFNAQRRWMNRFTNSVKRRAKSVPGRAIAKSVVRKLHPRFGWRSFQ